MTADGALVRLASDAALALHAILSHYAFVPGLAGLHGLGWMFPPIITVLNRDYNRGTIIPTKDCSYKGAYPKVWGLRGVLKACRERAQK